MENPATQEDPQDQTTQDGIVEEERFTMPTSLSKEYEIYKS